MRPWKMKGGSTIYFHEGNNRMTGYDQWKTTDPGLERLGREEEQAERIVAEVFDYWQKVLGLGLGEVPAFDASDITELDVDNIGCLAESLLEEWFERLEDPGPFTMSVGKWKRITSDARAGWRKAMQERNNGLSPEG